MNYAYARKIWTAHSSGFNSSPCELLNETRTFAIGQFKKWLSMATENVELRRMWHL